MPQQTAYVVERLGKFHAVLAPGINFIIPFFDRAAYRHSLKEQAYDIPEQICITKDNVQVQVDGVISFRWSTQDRVLRGKQLPLCRDATCPNDHAFQVGKIDLDRCFEERSTINRQVVNAIDEAAIGWGVKILRYEIKNISPPQSVLHAMEKQMQAEREKRARILQSEGEKQSAINVAEGQKQQVVLQSKAIQLRQINEANGQAEAIRAVASATAEALTKVAHATQEKGGFEAVQLRVAEQLVEQFGNLARTNNTLILPANFGDIASMISGAMSVVKHQSDKK